MSTPKILPGSEVCMHFSLALPDGTEVVSSFGGTPLDFVMGDGTLTEGLELALFGLRVGDEQTLTIDGDTAYGPRDEGNVQWLALDRFPADLQPEVGQIVVFDTPGGGEVAGAILRLEEERARVDFNHPLAGREVVFRVRILAIDPPAADDGG